MKKSLILCLVIFMFSLSMAHADPIEFGSWLVGEMDKKVGGYAATYNDSMGVIGQYCFTDDSQCLWLLMNDVNCIENSTYSVLVNADVGASTMELYCLKKMGDKPRYAFSDFKAIDNVIKTAKNLGIAFPMQDGQFTVSRFKLNGATEAVQYMRDKAEKVHQEQIKSSTKDLKL